MGKRKKKTFSLVADQEIYYFGIKGINFVSTPLSLAADCLRVVRVVFYYDAESGETLRE